MLLLVWFGPYTVVAKSTIGLISVNSLIYLVLIFSYAKINHQAIKYFVITWSIFILSVILRVLRLWNFIPAIDYSDLGLQVGGALGALLLGLGLVRQLRVLEIEKGIAQDQLLTFEQNAKRELAFKVASRTRELRLEKEHIQLQANARSEYFAHINHEIRTPTTVMKQYLRFLQRGIECELPTSAQTEHLDVIHHSVQKIRTLTDQLLDEEKLRFLESATPLTRMPISDVLQECLTRMKPLFYHSVVIRFDDLDPNAVVLATKEYLESIFDNIISNAAKYTEHGQFTVCVCRESEWVKVIFSDTGIGIAESDLEKIFTLFERSANSGLYPGSGIGLAICKSLVTRLGGELQVRSALGKGSVFTLTLKRA
jgi:two-component system sensor histidine kinase BarA